MLTKLQNLPFGKIALGVGAAIIIGSTINYNDSGVSTRVQQPIFGHSWVKEEGYYFTLPLVSRTKSYNQKGTIASSDNRSIIETASLTTNPRDYQFADSYEMGIEWSMRYEIPMADEDIVDENGNVISIGLESMHKSLKSEDNLLGNTLMPFAQTLVNDSVNQMLGGEFAQGGRNALRTLIDNQSQHGLYQTKVTKVPVKRSAGNGTNEVTGGASRDDLMVTKVVYLEGDDGKRLRTPLSIAQYGIKVVPNSISVIDTVPKGRLVKYIQTKQDNIALQIEQDEKQKILAKEAKTKQLEGEKNLVVRTNALNIKKQEAIIAAEQRVAEATLQAEKEKVERQKVADLAIIDKTREQQIATANRDIQKANAASAKYEAQAKKELGFAEAAITKAKLAAKQANKTIYLAEINRDVEIAKAKYMTQTTLNMPDTVIVNGSNGSNNPTADLLNMKLVNDVTKSTK
ncbi:hypothetical protein VPHD479_0237 [Vibrio phage D479]